MSRRCSLPARSCWSARGRPSSARTAMARATAACPSSSTRTFSSAWRTMRELRVQPLSAKPFHPCVRWRSVASRARAAMANPAVLEEIAVELVGAVIAIAGRLRREPPATTQHHARIVRVLRQLTSRSAEPHSLADLARSAGLSPYHFLRTFKRVTGITPHQWLLRTRLREAALRLSTTRAVGDGHRPRRRLRGLVELHAQLPRRVRRLAPPLSASLRELGSPPLPVKSLGETGKRTHEEQFSPSFPTRRSPEWPC